MNPNDRNTSSTDPSRREQDQQGNRPLQGTPGTGRSWSDEQNKQNPNQPTGLPGVDADDEDTDESEHEAGANSSSDRETPDDTMRRERSERTPEKGGDSQTRR